MAFTLNSVQAYGIEAEEPVNKRYRQALILNISGAATDLTLDLSDPTGTFWTAVKATEPGTTALKAILDIQTRALSFIGARSAAIAVRLQILTATAAANQYVLTMGATNTLLPIYVFHTASAPTSNILVLEWVLKAQEVPVEVAA